MESQKYLEIKSYLKENFIGPDELSVFHEKLNIVNPIEKAHLIPPIPYTTAQIASMAETHLLVLIIPETLTGDKHSLLSMRNHFGIDPLLSEPCFYNQDWYINEVFAQKKLDWTWVFLAREVKDSTRGMLPEQLVDIGFAEKKLPSAVMCAYTFFTYYFHTGGKLLWESDYIWCSDKDVSMDRIYVGRYHDPSKLSKNGFSIHRHLSVKKNYGSCMVV